MNRREFIGGSAACVAASAVPVPAALLEPPAVWTEESSIEAVTREVWHLRKILIKGRHQWVIQDQPQPR